MIKMGCGKISITPSFKTELTGFTFRKGEYECVHSQIWAKATYFQYSNNDEIILISADLIWFEYEWTLNIKKEIQNILHKPNIEVIFHATHTHCAPNANNKLSPLLGKYQKEYTDFLSSQLKSLCVNTINNAEDVTGEYYLGKSTIPINRRVVLNGISEMKPNLNGIKDDTVTILVFKQSENIKSIIIHMACHPTTSANNQVSAEFMTNAAESLSKDLNVPVSILQGFSGDTRINLSKNNEFYRGYLSKDSNDFADVFKQEILQILKTQPINIKFNQKLEFKENFFSLPLGNTPDHNSFIPNDEVQKYWHEYFKINIKNNHVTTKLWYWKLGENLSFLFSDGEIVSEYGLFAKSLCKNHILTCGITNGIVSYIPTSKQITEKGLEAYDSIFFFMLPYVYNTKVEEIFKLNIKNILS